MKRLTILCFTALFCATLTAGEVLTNDDILRLAQAGLSPVTIEAKIRSTAVAFDMSATEMVRLANEGVPDAIIRLMLERTIASAPSAAPVAAVPEPPSVPAEPSALDVPARPAASATGSKLLRRYEVAILRPSDARCEGAELRIDGSGVKGSRCRDLDFDLRWSEVDGVCYDYGFRGVVTVRAGQKRHRVMTTTPAEAKRIMDSIRLVRPTLPVSERCPAA